MYTKCMASFKNIQKFVALTHNYNTQDNGHLEQNIVNLGDKGYEILQAYTMHDALLAFKEEYGLKKQEVGNIFSQAKAMGFVEHLTSEDDERVTQDKVLVTFKGTELIRRPRVFHRFLAWIEYRDKLAVLIVALISGSVIGNLDLILKWVGLIR